MIFTTITKCRAILKLIIRNWPYFEKKFLNFVFCNINFAFSFCSIMKRTTYGSEATYPASPNVQW